MATTPAGYGVYRAPNDRAAKPTLRQGAKRPPRVFESSRAAAEDFARWKKGELVSLHEWTPEWHRGRIRLSDGKAMCEITKVQGGWALKGPKKPHPLYMVDQIPPTGPIFIGEGEKACDAGWAIGLACVTSGSSDSADSADWRPLRGRMVGVLPDFDGPGERYANRVVSKLRQLDARADVRIVHLPLKDDGDDLFDFVNIHRAGQSAESIRDEVCALLDSAPRAEEAQQTRPPLTFAPFPVDALPTPVRDFVKRAAAATGTDPAFAALVALVLCAGCIGNRVAARVKGGWIEVAVLWGVIIARSGSVKSQVLKLASRPLLDIYKAARAEFEAQLREFTQAENRHDAEMQRWRKSERDGGASDPPLPPEPPVEKRVHVSDITIERLAGLLQKNPLGLVLIRDELAAWVGGFDRYSVGGKGSDQPNWLSMHDASSITVDRKSDQATTFVERAAVSVVGTSQPGTVARLMGQSEREAGFLARVLVVNPPEKVSLWTEAEFDDHDAQCWHQLLQALLDLQPGHDDDGSLKPRLAQLSPEAREVFVAWHDRHARELADLEDDDLRAHFSKLKGTCIRIALILTCVEIVHAGSGPLLLEVHSIRSAIRITDWLKHETRRVYTALAETPDQARLRRLRDWIARRGGRVSIRDVTHFNHAYRNRPEDAKTDMDALEAAGEGQWTHPAPGPLGGCPTTIFELNEPLSIPETPSGASADGGFGESEQSESVDVAAESKLAEPTTAGSPSPPENAAPDDGLSRTLPGDVASGGSGDEELPGPAADDADEPPPQEDEWGEL